MRWRGSHCVVLIVLFFFLHDFLTAQIDSIVVPIEAQASAHSPNIDSSIARPFSPVTSPHSKRSPWLAVGLSALIPGAGQVYNENYWKPLVIWGLTGYWVYEWMKLNTRYNASRIDFEQSISPFLPDGNSQFKYARDFYRDERDKFAWYLGALYFLNLVDAYVGAQLYDFDVSPDLSSDGRIVPKMTATLRYHF